MRTPRQIKAVIAMLVGTAMVAGAWAAFDYHRHRVIVVLPDGAVAAAPSVVLDYDPIHDYHPTRLEGREGVVHIPRKMAYGRGWETMKIYATHSGKHYGATRSPSECAYPMTVELQELPSLPPPPSTLEQAARLLDLIRQIAR